MKTKLLAHVFLVATCLSAYANADNFVESESYEVATLVINLAKGIARNLGAPIIGAERIVTRAVVSEDYNSRIYYIEGKDIHHTGLVVSTFWLRLTKPVGGSMMTASVDVLDHHEPIWGRPLPLETARLLGPLLNSLYDIADLDLDHRKVVIEDIWEGEADTIHILGLNKICDHDSLNRFRLSLIRRSEGNRAWYETELEHPYGWDGPFPSPIPGLPLPAPSEPWPVIEPPVGTLP
jgi:hypothetical protein